MKIETDTNLTNLIKEAISTKKITVLVPSPSSMSNADFKNVNYGLANVDDLESGIELADKYAVQHGCFVKKCSPYTSPTSAGNCDILAVLFDRILH